MDKDNGNMEHGLQVVSEFIKNNRLIGNGARKLTNKRKNSKTLSVGSEAAEKVVIYKL